jgi:transcriptional regulator with XRE-family HTH domain
MYALAQQSGIGVATISEIESGANKNPGILTVSRLASVLSVSLDYLAGSTDDPTPPPRRRATTARAQAGAMAAHREALAQDLVG